MLCFGTNRGKMNAWMSQDILGIFLPSISAAMIRASNTCSWFARPATGQNVSRLKGTGEALAHKGEETVTQRICSVKGGKGQLVLKPVMARGRHSWK